MPSRRNFLVSTSMAAGVAFFPAPALGARPARLSRRAFLPLVGQSLRCYGGGGSAFPLTLAAVREGPSASRLEQFSLVFEGPEGVGPLERGDLYRLCHPTLGALLVRLEPSADRKHACTADFCLLM